MPFPKQDRRPESNVAFLAELQRRIAIRLLEPHDKAPLPEGEVNESDLDRFQETLIRKRLSQTRSCLPLTSRRLAENFAPSFRKFAEFYQPSGDHAILKEAYDFAQKLIQHHRSEPEPTLETTSLLALMEFEAQTVRWQMSSFFYAQRTLGIRLRKWLECDLKGEPERGATILIAWRFGSWGFIRMT